MRDRDTLSTSNAAAAPALVHAPGVGLGASILARLGDRHLVFSEDNQSIHELSDLAAYVWRSLDAGMASVDIARELNGTGVNQGEAARTVATTIDELRALRTKAAVPTPSLPSQRLARLTILICDVAVQLLLSKALVGDVQTALGDFVTDLPESDALLCARLSGDTVSFSAPGQPDWSCERSHFIPLLKAQLIQHVLVCARYEVALHAAALVRRDKVILLLGSPGAGKTTLAIALAKAGLEVLADDVVLLGDTGLVTGVSFPFTAKSSSWPLLSRHWPGLLTTPSHCRPDGQTLCYIPHDPVADPRPRRIGAVVILDRQLEAATAVEELDLASALAALIADGATRDERLSASGFTALIDGLADSRCYRLTYSDLIAAADAVCGLPG